MTMLVVIVALIAAAPFVREAMRTKMGRGARARAPGHFADLSQGATHYDWIGPARGPVIVCVHGLTTPSYVWRALAPLLVALGFRVLIYDLYGRGFSDRPKGRQDAAFFLTQLTDLLQDQEVDGPITLAGYSMGGAIVTAFAHQFPDRVQRLILLAPAGMVLGEDWLRQTVRDMPIIGDWLMHALWPRQFERGVMADTLPAMVDNIAARQIEELEFQGFVPAVLSSTRGMLAQTQEAEHRAAADADIPVLAVWGRDDPVIPLRAMGTLTKWNRHCRHEVVEGAAHGLPYTHPQDVADAVQRALDC